MNCMVYLVSLIIVGQKMKIIPSALVALAAYSTAWMSTLLMECLFCIRISVIIGIMIHCHYYDLIISVYL